MRKRSAPSLSARFKAYQQFVERVPLGMAILHAPDLTDTNTWQVVACNWLASRLVGSSAHAFLTGPISINLPASQNMPDLIRQTLRYGRVKALGQIAERDRSRNSLAY